MKLSKRDKGLLLGLLGFLVAVAAYVLVFNPMKLSNEQLKIELDNLKEREANLVELEKNMDHYKQEIVTLTNQKDELIAEFPAEVKPENEIMYAVELEDTLEVEFSALNYGTPVEIAAAESNAGLVAYCTPLSANYQATYQGLKSVITYTNAEENRMVVDTVTASYDGTTGNLIGNMTFNMYTLEGTDKMYEKPYVPAMPHGIENIFGTIELRDTF